MTNEERELLISKLNQEYTNVWRLLHDDKSRAMEDFLRVTGNILSDLNRVDLGFSLPPLYSLSDYEKRKLELKKFGIDVGVNENQSNS